MYETLHYALAPYYLYIKLIHVPAAFFWLFSVVIGFMHFLVPVMQMWRNNPDKPGLVPMRNWVFERFDHGVVVEHVAYPVVLISGVLLFIAGGWGPEAGWLMMKLALVIVITVPMEAVDYHISHFNGNKRYLREKSGGDWGVYESALHRHWWFFLVTTPIIGLLIVSILILAFLKPF